MKSNNKKFSLSSYLYHRKKTLSFFGLNRFHDWVILLIMFTIALIAVSLWAGYVYMEVTSPDGQSSVSNIPTVPESKPVFLGFPEPLTQPADSPLYIDPGSGRR